MKSKKETVTILDFGQKRKRKGARTVTVSATPLVHVFDEVALAAPVATSIRDAVERSIETITATASPATIKRRIYSRRVLVTGRAPASVVEQYGSRPPKFSTRLYNDSGALADGLAVKQRAGVFTTELPDNRGTYPGSVSDLAKAVPVLAQPRKLLADRGVKKAIEKSAKSIVVKAKDSRSAKSAAAKLGRENAAKALVGK